MLMSVNDKLDITNPFQHLNSLVAIERCNHPVSTAFQNCAQIFAN